MDRKTTRSLSRILEDISDAESADRFIEDHGDRSYDYFYEYLNDIISQKNLATAQVVANSGISKNYVYNILNGDKKNPGRDKVIALSVGAKMTYRQLQRGLEIAGLAPLYPKDARDVRIAVAVNSGIENVTALNLLLMQYNLAPLKI